MPTLTSHDRQYQLATLAQVRSEFTFCQFMIVRTMQQAAVLHTVALREWADESRLSVVMCYLHKTKTHQEAKTCFDTQLGLNFPEDDNGE